MMMKEIHLRLLIFAAGLVVGIFLGHGLSKPVETGVKIERDTVIVVDTIPDYQPAPKDSVTIRYVTKLLPVAKTDTVERLVTEVVRDTVAVQVPITSKHYGGESYDAWVSGFEPSLDSIRVYQKTEYVNATITKTVKESKRCGIGLISGYGYDVKTKAVSPFIGIGVSYNLISF